MLNVYTACGLNIHTGYGKLEIGLLKALAWMGVPVRTIGPASWDGLRELPDIVRLQWLVDEARYPVTLVIGVPERCFDPAIKDTRKVFYGMSETTAPSPEWVELFNAQYAAVLVTCPDLVTYYQAAGVKVPVYNVGMGMDYRPFPAYHKDTRKIKEWRKPNDGKFVFLSYSYNDMRKGAHVALQAFNSLFEATHPDVELWIKVRPTAMNWWDYCTNERVRVIPDTLTEAAWYDLLRQVDCMVFPSYGEGFGLPPRESVLCGTPAIATQWLGMADVENWGIPIHPGRLLPAHFDFWDANAEGSQWREPDLESLKAAMSKVYAMSPEARWVHALRGRRYLKNFTWQKTAVKILDVVKGLEHGLNSTAA